MRFCGSCGSRASDGVGTGAERETGAEATDRSFGQLRAMVGEPVAERLLGPEGRLGEERRLVTALFADISGFTALAQRLDPEELQEVVDPLVARLSAVAARHGAYVEKFAGDALLAVFGAPVAHEDDADRALFAALEMHQELDRARSGLPAAARDLTLHVGVNSGHGVARLIGGAARTDYGVLGDAVILAQRLESAAPAGETYVGETTLALLRGAFATEPVGPLALKGIAGQVAASRLIGPAEVETVTAARPTALVGREPELATIALALRSFRAGGVVIVRGEAGAGKSSLVDEARHALPPGTVRWLATRCLSYGSGSPFRPLGELVRAFAGARLDDPPARAADLLVRASGANSVQGALPFLARLAGLPLSPGGTAAEDPPDWDDPTVALEPEGFRRVLPDAIAEWLAALGALTPVALLVEDVHWIDDDSRDLLTEVAARLAGRPVGFILTTRDGEGAGADAIAGAAREAGVAPTWVDLVPIDPDGVGTLIREILGGEPPPGLAEAVAERSGGNPYFVLETVRALQEDQQLLRDDAGWRLAEGWDLASVPATIEGVLGGRIDRLPASTAWLLQQAAVVGRRVRGPLLRAIAEPSGFDARLEELIGSGFVDRAPGAGADLVLFHHALVQEVAYARLLRRQRRELHLQVADAVEAIYGTADDEIDLLARHLWQARAGLRAVRALRLAAARARGLFANEAALRDLRRAAEIAVETPEAQSFLPGLGLDRAELEELVGDYEHASEGYRAAAAATGDLRAWRGAASVARKTGRYEEALAILDEALKEIARDADRREVWFERAATLTFSGHFSEAVAAAGEGLSLGPDDDRVAGLLLAQRGAATLRLPGRETDALRDAQAAEAILERFDDVRGLVVARRTSAIALWQTGQLQAAAVALRATLVLAERTGGVEEIGGTLVNLGLVELALERPEAAVAVDRQAEREFARVGHASGRMIATANLAEALVMAGDLDGALATAREALRMAVAQDDPATAADLARTLTLERLRRGDGTGAMARGLEAATMFNDLGDGPSAAAVLRLAADGARMAGDLDAASAHEAHADTIEHAGGTGPATV